MHLIPLANKETQISLKKRKYEIFVAGGHTVETEPGFSINIFQSGTGEQITLKELTFRVRTYENNKKAVKCYTFEAKEDGNHTVVIGNPECLRVKNSILSERGLSQLVFNLLLPERARRKDISEIDLIIRGR